jgi:hypothetical protein
MAAAADNASKFTDQKTPPFTSRLFSTSSPPSLFEFKKLITESHIEHYPLSNSVVSGVSIYEVPEYSSLSQEELSAFQDEWYHILLSGPGVFVTKRLYKNNTLIGRVNEVFSAIIADEKKSSNKKGDHFAGAGANDRIWNSFSKHCLRDPESFLDY